MNAQPTDRKLDELIDDILDDIAFMSVTTCKKKEQLQTFIASTVIAELAKLSRNHTYNHGINCHCPKDIRDAIKQWETKQ